MRPRTNATKRLLNRESLRRQGRRLLVGGTTTTYSYDNAQRLSQVLNQNGVSAISQHSYTLDSVGNRTALAEVLAQVGGETTNNNMSYSYDVNRSMEWRAWHRLAAHRLRY